MKHQIIFFILLVLLFAVGTAAGHTTSLTILRDDAKMRPTKRASTPAMVTTSRSVTTSGLPTLGRQGNISAVKSRAKGTKQYYATQLPNISKQISSKSAIIIDSETGKVLYAKNPDSPRQPASTLKVITGLIAIQSLNNSDTIKVSPKASKMPRSKIYIDPKKQYQADDMINAILLASANDASVAVAETIAGSERSFADIMTEQARRWGATRTVCRNASGLTSKGQQSTARDLAIIFQRAMKNSEFARRMHRRKVTTSYGKTLYNHNKALWKVEGAQAGKTGYTNAARQTYVGQFTRDNHTITIALMGSETMWSDVKNLVNYGFKKKAKIQLAAAEGSKKQ
jgi:D-alanyl-D-alanine carboxypeptidase (penicillin-binding protein 5/6)